MKLCSSDNDYTTAPPLSFEYMILKDYFYVCFLLLINILDQDKMHLQPLKIFHLSYMLRCSFLFEGYLFNSGRDYDVSFHVFLLIFLMRMNEDNLNNMHHHYDLILHFYIVLINVLQLRSDIYVLQVLQFHFH